MKGQHVAHVVREHTESLCFPEDQNSVMFPYEFLHKLYYCSACRECLGPRLSWPQTLPALIKNKKNRRNVEEYFPSVFFLFFFASAGRILGQRIEANLITVRVDRMMMMMMMIIRNICV